MALIGSIPFRNYVYRYQLNMLNVVLISWQLYEYPEDVTYMSGYYFSTKQIDTTMSEFYFICHFLYLCFHSLSGIWSYKVGMTEAAIRKHAPTPLPNGWDSDS